MNKAEIRASFLEKRRSLSKVRKEEACIKAIATLEPLLLPFLERGGFLFSFYPLLEEIDITPLHTSFLEKNLLCLPKVEGKEIIFYQITPETVFKQGSFKVMEPVAGKQVIPQKGSPVLVPGVAFGEGLHRIGYGKGFYDRFLKQHPEVFSIGVGFLEQFYGGSFPSNARDVPLKELFLF